MPVISIKGMDKVEVFRELYADAKVLGLGVFNFVPGPMSREEAEIAVAEEEARRGKVWFDYVRGRILKVDLSGDEFDPRLYDRDNGEGAAARAVARVAKG
jgi:hypothetical protein